MASVNKVILMGNLTRDPEVRYTPKGTAVTDMGMAMNRTRMSEGGERIDETTFVDVTLWGRQAELAGQYLKKGNGVYIEGRLQLDSWDDKTTGQKRSKLKVVGEQMQFLPKAGGSGDGGGQRQSYQEPAQSAPAQQSAPPRGASPAPPADSYSNNQFDDGDDIPF
ncbi:single-stranded DNA-binding protein [Persicirhabdus sediminis]|uniref:Single-stranded DNA-binding protein n=1 Tax=Persicirhabdus sediminis TaxID=454144 RepID=A0A8J7MH35_9BACT|nr:single-stranded DNA-binding protein [Persicirhabdus sediminis]MBK1792751.1 single-stranded DNA-binding protein [Persicirhabdus sediminis]